MDSQSRAEAFPFYEIAESHEFSDQFAELVREPKAREEDARVSGKIRRQSRAAIVAYSADCPLL